MYIPSSKWLYLGWCFQKPDSMAAFYWTFLWQIWRIYICEIDLKFFDSFQKYNEGDIAKVFRKQVVPCPLWKCISAPVQCGHVLLWSNTTTSYHEVSSTSTSSLFMKTLLKRKTREGAWWESKIILFVHESMGSCCTGHACKSLSVSLLVKRKLSRHIESYCFTRSLFSVFSKLTWFPRLTQSNWWRLCRERCFHRDHECFHPDELALSMWGCRIDWVFLSVMVYHLYDLPHL